MEDRVVCLALKVLTISSIGSDTRNPQISLIERTPQIENYKTLKIFSTVPSLYRWYIYIWYTIYIDDDVIRRSTDIDDNYVFLFRMV